MHSHFIPIGKFLLFYWRTCRTGNKTRKRPPYILKLAASVTLSQQPSPSIPTPPQPPVSILFNYTSPPDSQEPSIITESVNQPDQPSTSLTQRNASAPTLSPASSTRSQGLSTTMASPSNQHSLPPGAQAGGPSNWTAPSQGQPSSVRDPYAGHPESHYNITHGGGALQPVFRDNYESTRHGSVITDHRNPPPIPRYPSYTLGIFILKNFQFKTPEGAGINQNGSQQRSNRPQRLTRLWQGCNEINPCGRTRDCSFRPDSSIVLDYTTFMALPPNSLTPWACFPEELQCRRSAPMVGSCVLQYFLSASLPRHPSLVLIP